MWGPSRSSQAQRGMKCFYSTLLVLFLDNREYSDIIFECYNFVTEKISRNVLSKKLRTPSVVAQGYRSRDAKVIRGLTAV